MIKSSIELLKYIAENESMEFYLQYFYSREHNELNWKDNNLEEKINKSNPSFISDLSTIIRDEVLYPNVTLNTMYSIKPVLIEGKVAFAFCRYGVENGEMEREGEESLASYLSKYLGDLAAIPGFEEISMDNFTDFIDFNFTGDSLPCDVFDKKNGEWLSIYEHPSEDTLDRIFSGIMKHIESEFDSTQEVIVENNTIRYFTWEQLEGESFIVKVDLGDIFEDEIEYDI